MMPVIYSEPYQRSKMEYFAKIVQAENLLIISAKCSILVIWPDSEYPSECWNLFFLPMLFQNCAPWYEKGVW